MVQLVQKLISDDIRHTELWYPLYRSLCENPSSSPGAAIKRLDPQGINRGSWEGAFEDLRLIGVICTDDRGVRAAHLQPPMESLEHPLEETAFKAWVLSQINRLSMDRENERYTNQGHFPLIFRYLAEEDIRYLNKNDQVPMRQISDYFSKNRVDVKLNPQKTTYWISIATYLGLGYRIPGGICIALHPDVFFEMLKSTAAGEKAKRIPLPRFMLQLDSFFGIFPRKSNGVDQVCPPIISHAFYRQLTMKRITLSHRSDTTAFRFDGVPLGGKAFTDIEVVL